MIEFSTRKAATVSLDAFCHHSSDVGEVEAVEWSNGEGVDVTFLGSKSQHTTISLTWGELAALRFVTDGLSASVV